MFSCFVFDECHRAKKNHVFAGVLHAIAQSKERYPQYTPRVVGLSDTIVEQCDTHDRTNDRVDKMLELFGGRVAIYQPNPRHAPAPVEEEHIPCKAKDAADFDDFYITAVQTYLRRLRLAPFPKSTAAEMCSRIRERLPTSYSAEDAPIAKELFTFLDIHETFLIAGAERTLTEIRKQRLSISIPILWSTTSTDSTVLDSLLQYISPQKMTIVFVKTKLASEVVQANLAENLKVKVGRVVGKRDGGMTGAQQQREIDAFRREEVRVIVATSVLEEGLDVPRCDLVVCLLSERLTFRQVIQSRGRVRAGGRFVCVALLEGARGSWNGGKEAVVRGIIATKHNYVKVVDEIAEPIRGGIKTKNADNVRVFGEFQTPPSPPQNADIFCFFPPYFLLVFG